jgi:tRNA dimethylallyltransferase
MSGIGYRQICEHLAGRLPFSDAVAQIKTETHRLARMQHTWFRQDDPRILWLDASLPDVAQQAIAAVRVAAV